MSNFAAAIKEFLSTPSARRATRNAAVVQGDADISIHALREEGDHSGVQNCGYAEHFYPRPPRGGRQGGDACDDGEDCISIHALREEGDITLCILPTLPNIFLSTPSARRATTRFTPKSSKSIVFLSTPSARRATAEEGGRYYNSMDFYPRPPRGGRRHNPAGSPARYPISIHALREEGDRTETLTQAVSGSFLSTPSARRATFWSEFSALATTNFYPRPPRGGRPSPNTTDSRQVTFLSTPSARRATSSSSRRVVRTTYFYPRPPRGGRPTAFLMSSRGVPISIHALREEGD